MIIERDEATSATGAALQDKPFFLNNGDLSRRQMLRRLFLGLGAVSLPIWARRTATAQTGLELALPLGPLTAQDYGPLVEKDVGDVLSSVDHRVFAPEGFDARVVMRAGVNPVDASSSGPLGHTAPDGGAVFPAPDGGWVYVSNSEASNGGVSALRFDASGNLIDYYPICTGTRRNCAGGQTPWGTWITCEETTGGYAFECDPFGTPATQRRLDALGARNNREAVAIDPIHHACYQTLDTTSGKFVRFVSAPSDLEVTAEGVMRMRMQDGVSQRLRIPPYADMPGYDNAVVPNTSAGSSVLRQARPIEWVSDSGNNGTNFNGGEGIWYCEIPEPLRTTPSAGTVPTRGVIFFASKGDNRIWAIDLDNDLIELIYDTHNGQAFANLNNAGGATSNFNQVDNLVVSPAGDVLVAEDGSAMRLALMTNNQPAKLLMQITRGGSEICGPAFTPDGSRLYFSSQRGPSGPNGTGNAGVIYELTIPPQFRALQSASAFTYQQRDGVAPGVWVTSESVTVAGFVGQLLLTISVGNEAQYSINGGEWTDQPGWVAAGDAVHVRHLSSATVGEATETFVTIGLPNFLTETVATFRSVTSEPARTPNPFDFGTQTDVPGSALIESAVVVVTGFNLPVPVRCGPHAEYRIDGGSWTTAEEMLEPGQALQMRHLSNRPSRSVRRTHLRVGGVTGHFTTRTR